MSQGAMQIKPTYSIADLTSEALTSRLVPRHLAKPSQLLRSTLLQAVDGFNLQAVYPAHCLLDLQKLNAGGTDWRARSPNYRQALLRDLKLSSIPALPGILSMPLCVDLGFVEGDWVFVESGNPAQLLRFARTEYLALMVSAEVEQDEFTVPLMEVRPNLDYPNRDETEIRSAVEAKIGRASCRERV